jgi:hypothetical protein
VETGSVADIKRATLAIELAFFYQGKIPLHAGD